MLGIILSLCVRSVCLEFRAKDTQLKETLGFIADLLYLVCFWVLLSSPLTLNICNHRLWSASWCSSWRGKQQQQAEDISNRFLMAHHFKATRCRMLLQNMTAQNVWHIWPTISVRRAFLRAICHTSFKCAIVVFASAH